jgi:hypothetical protein
MTAFVTDNPFEIELQKTIQFCEAIKRNQTILMSTGKTLPQKEKLLLIQKIQNSHKQIAQFLEKSKQQENYNSGIRFKLENLKQKFSVLQQQWRKIDDLL